MFSISKLPPDTEHPQHIPAVKLIDFGRGKDANLTPEEDLEPNELETGSRLNLWGAGNIMAHVICVFEDHDGDSMELAIPPMNYSYRRPNGSGRFVWTNAPEPLREAEFSAYISSVAFQSTGFPWRCCIDDADFVAHSGSSTTRYRLPVHVSRCVCAKRFSVHEIPRLSDVLRQAEERVANRGPDENPQLADLMEVEETDEFILRFVEDLIFNA
ncbi:hypothetical protein F5Y18DRAFT_430100 [Xylariaceae sp. FL1019]|nr:hypothetical protein F5Y18DRAFT_430100 [Xylariaceae sp. FL1019]